MNEALLKCFAPLNVCGAQINRLGCSGEVLNGPTDVKISCAMVDVNLTPNVTQGQVQTARNGGNGKCAQFKPRDEIDDYDLSINLCPRIDPGLMEMFATHLPVVDDAGQLFPDNPGSLVGIKPYNAADAGCHCNSLESCQSGVSMLIWFNNTALPADPNCPYVVFAFSKLRFQLNGSWNITNSYQNLTFTATPENNPFWIDPALWDPDAPVAPTGPGEIYPETLGLDVPWAAWATNQAPPGGCNCSACTYESADTNAYGGVAA